MPPSFPPDTWIRDIEALRRIARSLLGRDDGVEDVVQGVMLTALERPPRVWSRAWLVSVLRHRAVDRQRGERRRAAHHAALEPRPPTPATDDLVVRLETNERLSAAIRALPPPAREVVSLRFFDGLAPREIAAELDVPVKTVKSRLHRALAELRTRLEDGQRDGKPDWRAALAIFALPQPAAAVAATAATTPTLWILGGIDTMKRIAIVLALCLGLWGLWEIGSGGPTAGEPGPSDRSADASGSHAPAGRVPGDTTDLEAARVEVRGDSDDPAPPDTVSGLSTGVLVAHVFWHDGAAAPDIGLALSRGGDGRPYHAIQRVVTNASGATHPMPLPPGPYRLRSLWDQATEVEVVAGQTNDVRIDLPAGIAIDGEVVDGEGRVVPDAAIWMQGTGSDWTGGRVVDRSDRAGRFRLRSAPKGVSLAAFAEGFAPSNLVDLDAVDTSLPPARVRLVLDTPGGTVRGVVSDFRGDPVSDAVVCIGPKARNVFRNRPGGSLVEIRSPPSVRTDDDGEFELHGLPLEKLPVAVRSRRHPIWNGTVRVEPGEPTTIAIQLAEPATLSGVVTDDAGMPRVGAIVHVFPEALDERFLVSGQIDYEHVFGHEYAVADREGRYRVANVAPGPVHAHALRGGDQNVEMSIQRAKALLSAEPGQQLEWNPVLTDGHVLEGLVLYRDGTPMGGVFVTARDEEEPDAQLVMVTDGSGRFRFVSVQDHRYSIGVQVWDLPDNADPVGRRGVRPDQGEIRIVATFNAPRDLELGSLVGRIDDAAGVLDLPGAVGVTLHTAKNSWRHGVKVDGDRFECRRLAPGYYVPVVSIGPRTVFVGEWFELAPGQHLDLGTLTTVPTGAVRLRIVRDETARGLAATVRVTPEHAMYGESREIGEETELLIDGLPAGTHRIYVRGEGVVCPRSEVVVESSAESVAEIHLRGGIRCELEVHYPAGLDLGRLTTSVLDEAGETVWTVQQRSATLPRPYVRRSTLALGRYRFVTETTTGRRAEVAFEVTSLVGAGPVVRLELR